MRHLQLRRFFLGLAAIATPVPLIVSGCGGNVITDGHDGNETGGTSGTGGTPQYTGMGGAIATGGSPPYAGLPAGGYPNYTGQAPGGYPNYTGMGGMPVYVGTGGTPVYVGTGGTPIYTGVGGFYPTGGSPSVTDGGHIDPGAADANIPESGSPDPCDGDGSAGPSGCGRRPPGLESAPAECGNALRAYFQEMARLEAASVPAFRRLGHELRAHGAPRSLVAATRRAAGEEVRHTRAARILAERFGGRYVPPRIGKRPARSLEEIALDNAAEGCVRETFGAMIATWQARASSDAVVRRIMRRIAVDETSHAALAIRVAEWTERRLPEAAARRVRDLRRSTAEAVRRELSASHTPPELVALAGVPSREDALGLARAMTERLWT